MTDNLKNYIDRPGNASFLLDIPGCEDLYKACKKAEETIKRDYVEFFRAVRTILETFAKTEELKLRLEKNPNANPSELEREILDDFASKENQTYNSIVGAAKIYGDRKKLANVMKDHYNLRYLDENTSVFERLSDAIKDLRKRSNKGSHAGPLNEDYRSSNEVIGLLFNIIAAYYGADYTYNYEKQPYMDYYPITKNLCRENGLKIPYGKALYFKKDKSGKIKYYIFIPVDSEPTDEELHAINILNNLWENNADTPENTVNPPQYQSHSNQIDFCTYVLALPDFPSFLSKDFIDSLSDEEKMQIISGIVKGIASLHNFSPPLYHRTLSADSFVVYKMRNGQYKPLLINYDCIKDTNEKKTYTVFEKFQNSVSLKMNPNQVFAPEIVSLCRSMKTNTNIDWAKADIYTLGLLIKSFECEFSEERKNLLKAMLSTKPSDRPDINTVRSAFCL